MMKKDLKNKKLVSALTVGISAMMALATPVTAYARLHWFGFHIHMADWRLLYGQRPGLLCAGRASDWGQ